jgi:hypothetical protein
MSACGVSAIECKRPKWAREAAMKLKTAQRYFRARYSSGHPVPFIHSCKGLCFAALGQETRLGVFRLLPEQVAQTQAAM